MIRIGSKVSQRHNFFSSCGCLQMRMFTQQELPKPSTQSGPRFEEPLNEIEFDSAFFATRALELAQQSFIDKQQLIQSNQDRVLALQSQISGSVSQNPIEHVTRDLEFTKTFAINNILKTDYAELYDTSCYNLNLKGKNFRSAIIFNLAKAIYYSQPEVNRPFEETAYSQKVTTLSACIEIAHNASLLQDDIIDRADSRRNQAAAHKVYGQARSIFSSNYMISRSARMITQVFNDSVHMSQLYSTIICNLIRGELIQARISKSNKQVLDGESGSAVKLYDEHKYFTNYMDKTYYKTASMISLGCRGVALMFAMDDQGHEQLFNFGAHLGLAFQIHDDILDFTQDEAQLGKPAFNDLKEGIVTAPIIYALLQRQREEMAQNKGINELVSNQWLEAVERRFQNEGDIDTGKQMLAQTSGLQQAESLSIHHIEQALECLHNLRLDDRQVFPSKVDPSSEKHLQSLVGLALKVKTRKY